MAQMAESSTPQPEHADVVIVGAGILGVHSLYEYTRNGTAAVFLLLCPLLGWRHLEVTARRGYREFAQLMKALVDDYFPKAEVIPVVDCDGQPIGNGKPGPVTRQLRERFHQLVRSS